MNVKELIEKYEYLNHNYFRRVDTSEVLRDLKQLDEPPKVTIPQLIADWIEQCKNNFGFNLKSAMNINTILHYSDDSHKVIDWIKVNSNQEAFVRAWLDGYEIEKEKRYLVKVKGMKRVNGCLAINKKLAIWFFGTSGNSNNYRTHHTRKELEEADFGWVFDCEGIEIEEVTE
jgi:hypothetical protein